MAPLRRIGLALTAAACLLLLFEAALGLLGIGYARWRLAWTRSASAGETRVLCAGDSFTFGVGAPRGRGYPEQLQTLLDERATGRKFRVVNRGMPGRNSSELLKALPGLLAEERPDILLVMTGWNDYNLRNSNYWRVADLSRVRLSERLRLRLADWSERCRTWRFLKTLWRRLFPEKVSPCRGLCSYEGLDEAVCRRRAQALAEKSRRSPGNFREWLPLGILLHRSKRFDEALSAVKNAVARRPEDAEALFRLGWLLHLRRDFDGAEAAFRRALRLDPLHERARDMLGFHEKRAPPPEEWLEALLMYDLSRIMGSARGVGAAVVLQTYPSPGHSINHHLRRALERLKREGTFIGVDHSAVFARLGQAERYFSRDEPDLYMSHLNEAGYRVVADGVFEALEKAGLLSAPAPAAAAGLPSADPR